MTAILILLAAHWSLSIFAQTFFMHRYGSHRMFTMSPFWERFFYLMAFIAQGPSFLVPRAPTRFSTGSTTPFADTEQDPHSPPLLLQRGHHDVAHKRQYDVYAYRHGGRRFSGGTPEWPFIDRLSRRWACIKLPPSSSLFCVRLPRRCGGSSLLPLHWIDGPASTGAIVNWCGHKCGYRNFDTDDQSKNTLRLEFVTHGRALPEQPPPVRASPNFAVRWYELDPTYQVMRVLAWLGIIEFTPGARSAIPDAAAVAR